MFYFRQKEGEYELTYYGKETKEQIIAQTYAAPLQEDRRFAGATTSEWTNMLIFGDNLQVLKSLIEMKRAGKLKNADGTEGVRLIYIDPPFASKQDFTNDEKAYSDKMKGAEFLEWLRKRLILLKEIMSVDGSIFVHLDWHKSHYMKVLMDEIFGEGNFINEIVWHYGTYVGNTKIIFQESMIQYWFMEEVWGKESSFLKGMGNQKMMQTIRDGRTILMKIMKLQVLSILRTIQKFDGYVKRFIKENGRKPKKGDVLLKVDGKLVDSVWDIQSVNPMAKEKNGYPTQKPEELLERIILSSSKEGDIVLDCFGRIRDDSSSC